MDLLFELLTRAKVFVLGTPPEGTMALYVVFLAAAGPLFVFAIRSTRNENLQRRTLMAVGLLVLSLACGQWIRDQHIVEYIGQGRNLENLPPTRNLILALPMPPFRDPAIEAHLPGRELFNATSGETMARLLEIPGNRVGVLMTTLLYFSSILGTIVTLAYLTFVRPFLYFSTRLQEFIK